MLSINENFLYNNLLASSLVQFFPLDKRADINEWRAKLQRMVTNREDVAIRNDYMWFLLLVLQSGKLMFPFDRPPSKVLKPLNSILPKNIYDEVLSTADDSFGWLENVEATQQGREWASAHETETRVPPALFLKNQPCPKEGIFCYMAAFSDHDS